MDLGDWKDTFIVQADSPADAKAMIQASYPDLFVTVVQPTKTPVLVSVNGTVDGTPVEQRLWASGVCKSELHKAAAKFFTKLNGGFKRKGKRVVQVISVTEVE
jgi:hypothetical protein